MSICLINLWFLKFVSISIVSNELKPKRTSSNFLFDRNDYLPITLLTENDKKLIVRSTFPSLEPSPNFSYNPIKPPLVWIYWNSIRRFFLGNIVLQRWYGVQTSISWALFIKRGQDDLHPVLQLHYDKSWNKYLVHWKKMMGHVNTYIGTSQETRVELWLEH